MQDYITTASELLNSLGAAGLLAKGVAGAAGAAGKASFEFLKSRVISQPAYQDKLHKLIKLVLEEYRSGNSKSITEPGYYFWQSRWVWEWVFSQNPFDEQGLLVSDLPEGSQGMHAVTQHELDEFTTKVKSLIQADRDLVKLYAAENLPVETFQANRQAANQRDEQTGLLTSIASGLSGLNEALTKPAGQAEAALQISLAFEKTSIGLMSTDNAIPGLDLHLDRPETKKLLTWLAAPLGEKEEPLAVLEGGAGMGKTGILKDVLLAVKETGTPVLALKADRLYTSSYPKLCQIILDGTGFDDLPNAIQAIRPGSDGQMVVLIDQLDALSQSLSARRELLSTYRELIQSLLRVQGIRLILSCRTFDLENDPLLQTYRGKIRVKTEGLSCQQIDSALSRTTFAAQTLSPELYKLLAVPLHLRIFCQLREPANIGGLTTLQALYDEYYRQQMQLAEETNNQEASRQVEPSRLRALCDELAETIYQSQRPSVSALSYESRYQAELGFALSRNLLVRVREGKHLQFFHQSFFDYLFARHFVETGKELTQLLDAGHQGLFIRSAISQVLQYLRGHDGRAYLQQIRSLLLQPTKYRLHIRLLIFQQLGQLTDPSPAELLFARQHLLIPGRNRDLFLENVASLAWAQWLVGQGVLLRIFQISGEVSSSERNLLWYIARYQPAVLLEVLDKLEIDDFTGPHISWALYLAREASEPSYELILDNGAVWLKANRLGHYTDILEARARISPVKSAASLYDLLKGISHYSFRNSTNNVDEYHVKKAIKNLLTLHPDVGYSLVKTLIETWVDSRSTSHFPEIKQRSIIRDGEFALHDPKAKHHYNVTAMVYNLAQQHLELAARSSPELCRQLLDTWPASPMITLLRLTSTAYLSNPEAFAQDIFQLLTREGLLQDAEERSYLNYYFRELIHAAYRFFSPEQQLQLIKIITASRQGIHMYQNRQSGEKASNGIRRGIETTFGLLTYGYLAAIPGKALKANQTAWPLFQELRRKYGPLVNKAPRGVRVTAGAPSPIATADIEQMQPGHWLKAFRKHAGRRSHYDYEAGLARQFREQIKAQPERMKQVLERLVLPENLDIPDIFLQDGLSGLADSAGFEQVNFTSLLLRSVEAGKVKADSTMALYLIKKCIIGGKADLWILELLSRTAIEHRKDGKQDPEADSDTLIDGVSTVGGSAAQGLLYCYQMREHADLIRESLEVVAADGSQAVRAVALYELMLATHLFKPDTQPVLALMLKLVGNETSLLTHTGDTLFYLMEPHFPELRPLLVQALQKPASHQAVADALTRAWVQEVPTSDELLREYWQHSPKAREESLKLLMLSYQELNQQQKLLAQEAFQELMVFHDEKLRAAFDLSFHGLEEQDFDDWLPILRQYVDSPAGRGRSGVFYDFLQKCVQEHSAKCIELAAAFEEHEQPDMQQNALEKKPLEVLISAYHRLMEEDSDSEYLEIAMDIFDRMLEIPAYRSDAMEVLTLVDRN